eukprot:scaffold89286_cov49-Prasinocladus_malaysianus.AAC.2
MYDNEEAIDLLTQHGPAAARLASPCHSFFFVSQNSKSKYRFSAYMTGVHSIHGLPFITSYAPNYIHFLTTAIVHILMLSSARQMLGEHNCKRESILRSISFYPPVKRLASTVDYALPQLYWYI